MIKNKKVHTEKYKPKTYVYLFIVILFTIIRFIPVSTGYLDLDDAINDLAIGIIASTVTAWIIEVEECRKTNKDHKEKERMVFSEYCGSINYLGYFVSKRCKKFSNETDELPLDEWLEKLRDESNYLPNTTPAATMERAYFHLASYIQNIKSTLLTLNNQYGILVEFDIIDTDDFRQHLELQLSLCDEICDMLDLFKQNPSSVSKSANELIIELVDHAKTFFPEEIHSLYSWHTYG